ncbi:MAG: hypothetical protein WBA98_03820, partial [Gordonia sp. (in: high G+C Gram-positive bacteria)]|uniref:hypothetical protein n=1 Tax=Gordonia sp. (in: high G+C Gram-positive bacteria) TaxID=84139 RepID=UPI003C763122
ECPCGERTVADVEVLASAEDMTFIAAAPQLVDDLAAEVEKLRTGHEASNSHQANLRGDLDAIQTPIAALHEDIELAGRSAEMARHFALDHGPDLLSEIKRLRSESGDLRVVLEEVLHVQHGEANEWETVDALLDGTLSRQDLMKRLWDDETNAIAERDRLRATIDRVQELADDIANGCLSCGSPSGGDNLADTILRALDGEAQ